MATNFLSADLSLDILVLIGDGPNIPITNEGSLIATIFSTNGNDSIVGGELDDIINGLDGNDTIRGGAGDDIIAGGNGNDDLYGGSGNDLIDGGSGADNIYGGTGRDCLRGGLGRDYVDGGDGNDTVEGGYGSDFLFGGNGNDRVLGGSDDDYLDGGVGNDYVDGENGDDLVTGGYSSDTVLGGLGNDTVDGGVGADLDNLFGGAGVDTFVLSKRASDNINDFETGEFLQVSASAFGGGLVAGSLLSSQFLIGAGAATAATRFIYSSGDLFFDADGNGLGVAAVKIATLAGSPSLGTSNFLII